MGKIEKMEMIKNPIFLTIFKLYNNLRSIKSKKNEEINVKKPFSKYF